MVEDFVSNNIHELKDDINGWISENVDKEVVNVSYSSVMSSADRTKHFALVFYKNKQLEGKM